MADNAAQRIKTEVVERRRRAGSIMRKGRSGATDGEGRLNGKKANEEAAWRRKRESDDIHKTKHKEIIRLFYRMFA